MRIYSVDQQDILEGRITDVYFERSKKILERLNLKDLQVRMEVHSYGLPQEYDWGVFAGLEEALKLLEGRPFNVYAMPEGTLFNPVEPLLVVEGSYYDFANLETPLLGILRHSSSIATKAARLKSLAIDKTFLFFGLRAVHPAIHPMVDRAAYIGGMDGVAGTESSEILGLSPAGTMPHALILAIGDNVKAWKAFHEVMDKDVPRIMLVDTLEDERTEAIKAAELLGNDLSAIRLDTPSSRRGNFRRIIEEVRWTLNLHGYKNVKIVASGGLTEKDILNLKDIVDVFGVGTSVAFPPSVDLSMDIVEKFHDGRWVPFTKRGKWPGMKQAYRCRDLKHVILPWGEKPKQEGCTPLLSKYMENGVLIKEMPKASEIREYVINQLREFNLQQSLSYSQQNG